MSDETTARLALPFLASGQAQKELTHNEALALLDMAVLPVVEAIGTITPPTAPVDGRCWILGATPTGAWSGKGGTLAGWTGGGWRFVPVLDGMSVWSRSDLCEARHVGGHWEIGTLRAQRLTIAGVQVVGPRQPAIAAPTGGTVVDSAARQAISGIIDVLQQHGLVF